MSRLALVLLLIKIIMWHLRYTKSWTEDGSFHLRQPNSDLQPCKTEWISKYMLF